MVITTFAPVVTGIGLAISDALAETAAGRPERVCLLVPGSIAADECDCGQLALTIVRKYASDTFPVEANRDESVPGCPPPILCAVITISLLRCVPNPDDDGTPPACDALQAAAVTQDVDDATIRATLYCHLSGLVQAETLVGYTIGATTASGPDGGCGGSDTTITIGVDNRWCC